MVDKVKEAAAPHRQTGDMEDSVQASLFTANEDGASGSIEVTVPYASFVDTGRGPVVPVYAKALRFSVGGQTVFATYAGPYEGSRFFEDTVTEATWGECVQTAAAEISVNA